MSDRIINNELQAAYALNLCTVSVSQIIDYDDLQILEQEYEAILNNLNLQNMPDDDALLNILTQLLDTITFFRISEGDKQMVDKAYQHKMKNAIWSAVPNLAMVIASGDPVAMAVSLASQVGIGYMNYRKTKATSALEKEEQLWKLQRAAMEQFNGLRRELFDTAWRLSKRYKFEDRYRLTENQIKQYNMILMDGDPIRRYQRFDAIKDNFVAYPQFWYYFGNTANQISRDDSLELSQETQNYYRNKAYSFFTRYWETAQFSLLREDQISSACALELVDLLIERGESKDVIESFIEKAVSFSGNACDILQLCAVAFLRIGEMEKARKHLKYLVNENYNSSMNVQLLSGVLISLYNSDPDSDDAIGYLSDYEILSKRPDQRAYLVPWPTEDGDAEQKYLDDQKEIVRSKFRNVMRELQDRHTVNTNKLVPSVKEEWEYDEDYYSEKNEEVRFRDIVNVYSVNLDKQQYKEKLSDVHFSIRLIDCFNQLLSILYSLDFASKEKLSEVARSQFENNRESLNSLQEKMTTGKFELSDFRELQKYTDYSFSDALFGEIIREFDDLVDNAKDMGDISQCESAIYSLCDKENLTEPDKYMWQKRSSEHKRKTEFLIGYDEVLGEKARHEILETERKKQMERIIRDYDDNVMIPEKVRLHRRDSKDFRNFFASVRGQYLEGKHKKETLAIIEDTSFGGRLDLVLTTNGLICVDRSGAFYSTTYESVDEHHGFSGLYIRIINSDNTFAFPSKKLGQECRDSLLMLFKDLNSAEVKDYE